MHELILLKVGVHVSRFIGYLYSSKLVKTIVIDTNARLTELFKPTKGPEPKLIHVSPLYTKNSGGGVECIYSYVACGKKGWLVKCEGPLKPVVIDGDCFFYLGFHTKAISQNEVIDGFVEKRGGCVEFMNQRVCYEITGIEVLSATSLGLDIARRVLEKGCLKVVFSPPTLLRDPLRIKDRYKTYLPSPFNVFSTPIYTLMNAEGTYSPARLRRELLRIHRLFNETYSVFGGVKLRWVYYGKKPEPALIGYVNYRVNREYLALLRERVDVEEWLKKIFAYTIALGVGSGRAAGFGHVELHPVEPRGVERRNNTAM